jgi:hypothetical protein
LLYGQPHIDTKISLFIEIIRFFITALAISILVITIARKWSVISFSKVLKSNLSLYGTLIGIYIISFILNIYINNFSRKNDLVEKVFYALFFLILFLIQAFYILKYFYKNTKEPFIKGYKVLIILLYFVSLVYIVINYFPQNAYDKYLTDSKIYTYLPIENNKTLLDNSTLKIDSAISSIDYYSNKKTFEKDLSFTIYFTSRHKENVPFSFKALDSTNEFGGSSSQIKYKELYLRKLNDSIKIIVQGFNFKNDKEWDHPKNTDTIVFVKRKITIKKYP